MDSVWTVLSVCCFSAQESAASCTMYYSWHESIQCVMLSDSSAIVSPSYLDQYRSADRWFYALTNNNSTLFCCLYMTSSSHSLQKYTTDSSRQRFNKQQKTEIQFSSSNLSRVNPLHKQVNKRSLKCVQRCQSFLWYQSADHLHHTEEESGRDTAD